MTGQAQTLPRHSRAAANDAPVIALFALTAFVGAGLLFLVQPMVARLLLPLYGGSATVWSTSSLFFQVMLLAGYLYTDRTTSLLTPRVQQVVHAVVLLLPLALLPLVLPSDAAPPADASPVIWLVRTLLVVVGFPFLVLATTGPLVQRWYSWSGRHRAQDPYFLFAASNLGSFVGLLIYPFVIEPLLSLDAQLRLWSWLFVAFVGLTMGCLLMTARGRVIAPDPGVAAESSGLSGSSGPPGPLGGRRVLRWTALAFLPSGLMLAVTAHVSTDIAAIPLLWVVPLSIYLATFVVAFGRTTRTISPVVTRVAVSLTFLAAAFSLASALLPIWLMVLTQMAMLAAVAFAAHAQLAADRPDPSRLTVFYLVVAIGGALGGLLNGVVAPIVFDRVLEYAALVALVPLLLLTHPPTPEATGPTRERAARRRTAALGLAVALLVPLAVAAPVIGSASRLLVGVVLLVSTVAIAVVLPFYRRVSLVTLALLVVIPLALQSREEIANRRTFYGSYAVEASGDTHRLRHGTTLHGLQFLDERSTVPTTYYAPTGPLGDVFDLPGLDDVGAVGLGVGTIAAYGETGQQMTFFEIDAEVVELAEDPELFTYLRDSEAQVRTVLGDGRLRIADEPEGAFDLLVLDAFSSDAIPVHLLTVEAMAEYASRVSSGGVIAVHISNRVFDLRPVLRGAATELGWDALVSERVGESPGAVGSVWVVLGDSEALADLASPDWEPLPERSVTWTDDFSSLLSVLRF